MIKKDNMYSIVTSGVGVYGTFMRVGTDAEICSVDIDLLVKLYSKRSVT